jgi:hypothetical protein
MKLTKSIIAAAIAASLPVVAIAGTRDPGVNQSQHDQQVRIAQGVRSGDLTKKEARALRDTERAIRQEERADKSDGKLIKAEGQDLHQDLNAASRGIYGEKHDAVSRN